MSVEHPAAPETAGTGWASPRVDDRAGGVRETTGVDAARRRPAPTDGRARHPATIPTQPSVTAIPAETHFGACDRAELREDRDRGAAPDDGEHDAPENAVHAEQARRARRRRRSTGRRRHGPAAHPQAARGFDIHAVVQRAAPSIATAIPRRPRPDEAPVVDDADECRADNAGDDEADEMQDAPQLRSYERHCLGLGSTLLPGPPRNALRPGGGSKRRSERTSSVAHAGKVGSGRCYPGTHGREEPTDDGRSGHASLR